MNENQFWHSTDGQILTVRPAKNSDTVALTLAFWPRHPAEMDFLKTHLTSLHFTERSSLARIGIEMLARGPVVLDGNRLTMEVECSLYDTSFPNAPYWKKLLRPGVPVGRLFFAPAAANGWIDAERLVLEMMTGFKRAGADIILTYFAEDILKWLNK